MRTGMKNKVAGTAGVLIVLLSASHPVAAGDFSGVATIASEYIYRGQALSNHEPAISAGIDYQHDSGLFGGIWGSTIELENPFGRRDTELDVYLGYQHDLDGPWSLTATVIRYGYPGHTGARDYAHNELMLAATWNDRYTLEFAYTDDIYGFDRPARHWGLRGEWPVAGYWMVSTGIGMSDLTAVNTDRYIYWDAGASIRWDRFTGDLRWHDNETIRGRFSNWSAGSRLVASVSIGF